MPVNPTKLLMAVLADALAEDEGSVQAVPLSPLILKAKKGSKHKGYPPRLEIVVPEALVRQARGEADDMDLHFIVTIDRNVADRSLSLIDQPSGIVLP